jgi:hypothetical protein
MLDFSKLITFKEVVISPNGEKIEFEVKKFATMDVEFFRNKRQEKEETMKLAIKNPELMKPDEMGSNIPKEVMEVGLKSQGKLEDAFNRQIGSQLTDDAVRIKLTDAGFSEKDAAGVTELIKDSLLQQIINHYNPQVDNGAKSGK